MTATPNTAALHDLLDRVEAGKYKFNGWADQPLDRKHMGKVEDAYHGSLDAAKALHEAVLPGWYWAMRPLGFGVSVMVWRGDSDRFEGHTEEPSRCWLIAILKALIAAPVTPANEGGV